MGRDPHPLNRASMPTNVAQEVRLEKILEKAETGSLFSIRDLALEFNLSTSHLQHLFKDRTGTRLGRLLMERKLQRAAKLLSESNISVKEVAYAIGYKHPSSFIRAFERRYRQAPRQFQQEMLIERRFC